VPRDVWHRVKAIVDGLGAGRHFAGIGHAAA
jgi:hypothetical protein